MTNMIIGTKNSRVDQVKFVEDCLSIPYPFNFFKGCLPQISLGPFLNTLSHMLPATKSCISEKYSHS